MATIDFWFSIGSTYTYLAVERLPALARARGHALQWKPFNVREMLGWSGYTPFADKPNKLAYMWRDLERRADRHGLAWAGPAPYPFKELALANQVALLGAREGWLETYVAAAYRGWILEQAPPGEEINLRAALTAAGQAYERVVEAAQSDEVAAALSAETRKAHELGVFGSPNLIVDGELFWGDDRIEEALDWADRVEAAR